MAACAVCKLKVSGDWNLEVDGMAKESPGVSAEVRAERRGEKTERGNPKWTIGRGRGKMSCERF